MAEYLLTLFKLRYAKDRRVFEENRVTPEQLAHETAKGAMGDVHGVMNFGEFEEWFSTGTSAAPTRIDREELSFEKAVEATYLNKFSSRDIIRMFEQCSEGGGIREGDFKVCLEGIARSMGGGEGEGEDVRRRAVEKLWR